MSENRNRGIRDFSKYDSMPTEELEEILRLDVSAPEGEESDVELLLYVMGVLANRRNNTGNTGKTAFEAWESFQQHYLPAEEDLLDFTQEPKKSAITFRPWLRRLTAAAAVFVLVICIPLTANAFGWEEFWDVIAQWAKETFSFVSGDDTEVNEPSPEYDGENSSFQEFLKKNEINSNLVPTWIPEGYALETVEKDITPMKETYTAVYSDGEQLLMIHIQSFIEEDSEKIEIDEDLIEIYEYAGVEYYLFANMNQIRAVWTKESYECYISGELTIEEIKMMIDSIGKG